MILVSFYRALTKYICGMRKLMVFPLILIMMAKPLWPIAEYIIYYDYIITYLCENREKPSLECNGKCYLSKQLAKESRQQEDNPFEGHQSNAEITDVLFIYGNNKYAFDLVSQLTSLDTIDYVENLFSTKYAIKITHPPEA